MKPKTPKPKTPRPSNIYVTGGYFGMIAYITTIVFLFVLVLVLWRIQ